MKNVNFDSKWMTRLVALVCALIFWLFVIASENPDVYTDSDDRPVTFVGIQNLTSQNLILTSGAPSSVDLRLNGKLDRMYLLNEDTISVTVDLSSIIAPGEYELSYSVDTGISGVEATKKTEHIRVTVERLQTRTIPVRMEITRQPDEGYVCTEMYLDNDAVTVTGPESLVESIGGIEAAFSFSGIRASGSRTLEYQILNQSGTPLVSDELSTDITSVRLNYVMQQVKQVPLSVAVNATDLVGSDRIRCTVEPASLALTGSSAYVSGIHEISLGTLNLHDLFEQGKVDGNKITLTLPVTVPNGVTCDSMPDQAEVTIELTGLEQSIIAVPAENFVPIKNVRFITERLDIRVLGTPTELAATTPVTVLVTPLVSGEELPAGLHTIPVRVDADRSVTILGSYEVTVFVEDIPGL